MQIKRGSDNLNKINSYHGENEDEEDCQYQFFVISEFPGFEADENFNLMQNQDDQDFFLLNDSNLINQDIGRKINQDDYPLKINEFSQQKIHKNFDLYRHPKIYNAFKNAPKIKSKIWKQKISRRTKMKTE
ncbi:unnamed protein product (macronuclear) [Paramecium tetraurelia]|uniref:Uncharacterized protein n=1 Tax=Paramecium tetraurelia TaxID=5888 RepID=A0BZC7_PARTE|nr:uncharacterized protein GSPATT00033747001 [Paramecium tetraurelia]CAK63894.1 unnamed protein product [Paramecium tetraurelia]|eukprot:XP_001431292.1 hypothetical protein (macronuclear) [Paramecium tetraurelia strain d4-2]